VLPDCAAVTFERVKSDGLTPTSSVLMCSFIYDYSLKHATTISQAYIFVIIVEIFKYMSTKSHRKSNFSRFLLFVHICRYTHMMDRRIPTHWDTLHRNMPS
jgi:hypothetical protein